MIEYTSILFKKTPRYLLEKRNLIIMVLFVSIFAIIFINIYKPFGSAQWVQRGMTPTQYLLQILTLSRAYRNILEICHLGFR